MKTTHSQGPKILAQIAGGCVFAVGMAVLVGWMFDITALKSVFPGLVTMKPNTAMGMSLCGGALALLSCGKISKPIRLSTTIIAVVVIALGTNDAISGYGTDFIPTYELLIRSLPANSLAFATPPPVDGAGAGILNMTALRSIDLAIKEIAASKKAILIDLGKIVGLETSDGIHPKKTAYPLWIKAIVEGIENAMKCRSAKLD